jgi:tellurite methyltransferase
MNPTRLVKRDLLDPRSQSEAALRPIAGAVNIPFSELAQRVYELPSRSTCIRVAGPRDLAAGVVEWLEQRGRTATVAAAEGADTPTGALSAAQFAAEAGRLWEPSAFLEEVAPQLEAGSALDLACGSGRNAVFLAARGWKVTAVDVLPDALNFGRELERRYASGCAPISWVCADLEALWPGPGGRFELVTMFRYLHRPLLPRLAEWLNPGASIVLETFTSLHRERRRRPARAAHVLLQGELAELLRPMLGGMTLRHYSEGWQGEEHTARLWAQRDAAAHD